MSEYRNELIAQGMLGTTPSITPKQKQKLIEAIEEKKRNAYDQGNIAMYWAYADCIELIEEILP